MGHQISEEGVEVDNSKIQAIRNTPSPKNVKYLQLSLGMVTYIAKFVCNLSEKTSVLRSMVKKDSIFQ